ncbi:MAG: preprotein translocase subunit YajC [Deltaproteobacteria bacterium]|nr:preprotein translocase subunit YajC [Deltaproteobacteria bacterium]
MIDVLFAMGGGGSTGTSPQGGGMMQLLFIGAMFAIFYFLLIRPQQKKAKEHRAMLDSLKKGDKIISSGGLHGVITGISDDAITMEIAPKVRVKITRGSVAGKIA